LPRVASIARAWHCGWLAPLRWVEQVQQGCRFLGKAGKLGGFAVAWLAWRWARRSEAGVATAAARGPWRDLGQLVADDDGTNPGVMTTADLEATALSLVTPGKGLLAADESRKNARVALRRGGNRLQRRGCRRLPRTALCDSGPRRVHQRRYSHGRYAGASGGGAGSAPRPALVPGRQGRSWPRGVGVFSRRDLHRGA
jgi:hypothetical protein